MHARNFNIIICGCLFTLGQFGSAASATTELSKMRDCTEIELEAVIDQDASREDNLARLSQQFFQSVNTIDHCDREPESDAPAASSPDSDSASSQDAASDTASDAASESGGADGENASSPEADSPPDDTTASQIITPSSAQSDTPSGTATASGSLVGTNFEQGLTESAAPTASEMAGTTPQTTAVDTGGDGAAH